MKKDFLLYIDSIEKILLQMQTRGEDLVTANFNITNIFGLLRTSQLKDEWEHNVVGQYSDQVDKNVVAMIDWMVERTAKKKIEVLQFLNQQAKISSENSAIRSPVQDELIERHMNTSFDFNRRSVLNRIGTSIETILCSYSKETEAKKLAHEVTRSLIQIAAIEVGAIGVGSVLLSSLDITGIIGVSTIAVVGLGVLPYKSRTFKTDFRAKIESIRTQLHESLTSQFEREVEFSVRELEKSITPFSSYVNKEEKLLHEYRSQLEQQRNQAASIRAKVNQDHESSPLH
eukprot:TRINITY_DN6739_c0_g1_i1.p1 TRINITY_DN6739_c0_g1~~TRINITY_DN6739_c0_g1_i1.p1  ORF type:complete len:287 (-),score=89.34 TRINITY_DN6739_c0_g1_i1:86-946(-)